MDEKLRSFKFLWKIENFRFCDKRKKIISPKFTVDIARGTKWYLSIYYAEQESEDIGIGLFRCFEDEYISNINIEYNITVFFKGSLIETNCIKYEFKKNASEGCGYNRMFIHNELFSEKDAAFTSLDEDLSVECEMSMLENLISIETELPPFPTSFEAQFQTLFEYPSDNTDSLENIKKSTEKFVETNILCRASTKINVTQMDFFWTIKRFSSLEKNKKKFIFTKSSISLESCAFITLYLTDEDMIQIEVLVNKNISNKYLSLYCQVGVRNLNDKIEIKSTKRCYFTYDIRHRLCLNILRKTILSREENYDNENLNLYFLLTFVSNSYSSNIIYSTCIETYPQISSETEDLISKKVTNVLASRESFDITLKAQDQHIHAHKAILCNTSSVLDSLVDAEKKKTNNSIINVTDVDPDTLRKFVKYIYTRKFGEMDVEECIDLFFISEKYKVPSLTSDCRKWIKSNMSAENVCDILMCLRSRNDNLLKTQAMEFVWRNTPVVFASDKWTTITKKDPKLATEVILFMTTKLKNK